MQGNMQHATMGHRLRQLLLALTAPQYRQSSSANRDSPFQDAGGVGCSLGPTSASQLWAQFQISKLGQLRFARGNTRCHVIEIELLCSYRRFSLDLAAYLEYGNGTWALASPSRSLCHIRQDRGALCFRASYANG